MEGYEAEEWPFLVPLQSLDFEMKLSGMHLERERQRKEPIQGFFQNPGKRWQNWNWGMFTGMKREDLLVSVRDDGREMKGTVCELLEKGLWKAWKAQ